MYNLIIFQHWIQISISLYKFRQIQRNQTIQINNSIISRFQNKNLQHLDFNPSSTLIIAHYHGVSKPLFLLILHQEYSPKPPNLTSIKSSLPTDAFKLLLFEKEREREREKHTYYIHRIKRWGPRVNFGHPLQGDERPKGEKTPRGPSWWRCPMPLSPSFSLSLPLA